LFSAVGIPGIHAGEERQAKFKSVDTIKHRLGIRKTDGAYDGEITLFVGQVTSGK